ncbi:hybrid signal transduction histidine kinase M [Tanacetum coccineum]
MKQKTYNLLPKGPMHDAILKKKITRKEDIGGNFEIPCNIGGLKHINALVNQGSDVNVMPLSTYNKLTDERPIKTGTRLSIASHSYIYPIGIAEYVLVDVAGYVYPIDFNHNQTSVNRLSMLDDENPVVLLLSDKLKTITNLHILVPEKLGIDEIKYATWTYLFKHLCKVHELLDHILGKQTSDKAEPSNTTPSNAEWLKIDSIILSWIFITIAKPLQSPLVDEDPQMAKGMGDLSIDAYFYKIESIANVLKGLGSPMSDEDIVNIDLEGLPTKYDNVYGINIHRVPFPDLKMVCSMLSTEEMRLKSRAHDMFVDSTSSSLMVLLANSSANIWRFTSFMEKEDMRNYNLF